MEFECWTLLIVDTMDNWLFLMNGPHQTIYVLTWRRVLLRRIAANIRIVARIPWQEQIATCLFSSEEIRTRHLDIVPKPSTSLTNSKY